MGFWSTLGKIAGIAAPIVAAPFTGGASLAALGKTGASLLPTILNGASAVAPVLGAIAGGRSKGRADESQLLAQMDASRNQNATDAARIGLDSSALRTRQLVGADVLGGPGRGGVGRASTVSPQTLALMRQQALTGLNGGDAPKFTYSEMPKSNFLDTLLNTGATVGSLYGAMQKPKTAPLPYVPPPQPGLPSTLPGSVPNMGVPELPAPTDPLWLPKPSNPYTVRF